MVVYYEIVEIINTEKEKIIEIMYLKEILFYRNEFDDLKKKTEYIKNDKLESMVNDLSKFNDKTTLSEILEKENVLYVDRYYFIEV